MFERELSLRNTSDLIESEFRSNNIDVPPPDETTSNSKDQDLYSRDDDDVRDDTRTAQHEVLDV